MFFRLANFRKIVDKQRKLQQVVAFRSRNWILLNQTFNKLFGLDWNVNCIVDLVFVNLYTFKLTFTIFYITTLRCYPSNGTLPCSN